MKEALPLAFIKHQHAVLGLQAKRNKQPQPPAIPLSSRQADAGAILSAQAATDQTAERQMVLPRHLLQMEKLLELLMGLDFQHQRSLSSALNVFGSGGSIHQHGLMSEIDPMDQGQGAQPWSIDRVGVVGMGLIGGSIALDLSQQGVEVQGLVHREVTAERARSRGLAPLVSTDPSCLQDCDLVILALPLESLLSHPKRACSRPSPSGRWSLMWAR